MAKDIRFETYEKQRGLFGKIGDLREAVRELIDSDEVSNDTKIELLDVEIKLYDIMGAL